MTRDEFDREMRARYTENPDHLRRMAGTLNRIAAVVRASGGRDANGNRPENFEHMAANCAAKADRIEAAR